MAASSVAPQGGGDTPPVASPAPRDFLGRNTPEGFVLGLLDAMAEEDYARAARYLDLRSIPQSLRDSRGAELARDLQQLLDKGGWVAANWQLSSDPAGQQNDNLPPEQEQFATVRMPQGMVKLIAERVENPETGPIWLVSSETVGQMPDLLDQIEGGLFDRFLPEPLTGGPHFGGVPLGHWAALLLLAAAAYLIAWGATSVVVFSIHRIWRRTRSERAVRFLNAAVLPFRIYLAIWIFAIGAFFLGVSVIARQQFGYLAEIVAWVAIGWLLWRIVDALAEVSSERLSRRSQFGALSAVRFFRRSAKLAIAAIAGIAALNTLGFNVTAGIAALGIGGIAIALGAQKTVENLVGSLTLIADQPVRVGDFCRFGQTLGTVEDIGMRSTRIRTLDRTIVTVPNGEFSALQIENYSCRDRFWFHPVLALRYETTPDQIRCLLVELRTLLYAHPRVHPDPARVRFLGLGAAFAFPSRTLYMAQDAALSEDKRTAAEARVREWNESGKSEFRRFQQERIDALRASLAYPPEGSTSYSPPTSARTNQSPAENEPKTKSAKTLWRWQALR